MRAKPNRRDRWRTAVQITPHMPAAARLFCVSVLVRHMNASGIVSVPRRRLAAQANVSERRVTRFITQAKEAGFLIVVQPGYRTMTAVYQATFPDAKSGNTVFSHSAQESGNTTVPLCAGTECSPITAGKREHSVPSTSTYVLETGDVLPDGETALLRRADPTAESLVSSSPLENSTRHLRAVNG